MSDGYVGYIGGWLRDKEDNVLLQSLSSEAPVLAMRGAYKEVTLDPRQVIRVENQGNQGACQGHSISTCCEWAHIIQTNDTTLQLSRAMGYYETQRIDGIRGDSGSTISGGVKLSTGTGICEESLWPYPSGGYSNRRPGDWARITANAAKYKIGNTVRLSTYDGVRTYLGSGQGGISIGIGWGNGMSRAVVESYSSGGGGHAISLLACSDRKDSSGRPYIWMCNSWGGQFCNGGWSEWSPRAVEQMFRSRNTVAIGVSDMPNIQPREITLDDLKKKLRA